MPKALEVLLVDNQPIILGFFEPLLVHEGFTVRTARDGLAAIRELDASTPDVIVSDLVMPNIDGAHLCRIVRSNPRFKNTYIVILSAIAAEERLDLRAIGANACIAKGPLSAMKRHLLSILSDPNLDAGKLDETKVLGIDEIFERNITRELLVTKRHNDLILDNLEEGILEVSADGDVILANTAAQVLLGRSETDLLGNSLNEVTFRINGAATTGMFNLLENNMLPVGAVIFRGNRQLSIRLLPARPVVAAIKIVLLSDISAAVAAEREMRRSLNTKGVLLKEVHHRVKNNLSMIASLISLQSEFLFDKRDVHVLDQLRSRIQSISLVHQQLYLSDDLTHIGLNQYLHELTENLMESTAGASRRIEVELQIDAPEMDINSAIPLGLIVAELFTNAMKYAFSGRASGALFIKLSHTSGKYHLVVSDNGTGLPAEVDTKAPKTLGYQIISTLVGQLRGRLRITRGAGTTITIEFPGP